MEVCWAGHSYLAMDALLLNMSNMWQQQQINFWDKMNANCNNL